MTTTVDELMRLATDLSDRYAYMLRATTSRKEGARQALAAAKANLRSALEEVVADARRLAWFEEDAGSSVFKLGKSWYARKSYGMPHRRHKSMRDAIDAMQQAPEQEG